MKLNIVKSYWELTKPRITFSILITTFLGYYLGGRGVSSFSHFLWLMLGVALVCSGSSALNQYLERDVDALMERTKNRPIPSGQLSAANALGFGVFLTLIGVLVLYVRINLLTAFLGLLTAFLYVLVYTPMKRITWLNTTLGSVPGALPPVGGWAAAAGDLDIGAWVLFLIMFVWQHPHFYAIAWVCKEDYKKGGFKMLPVVEPDGQRMFRHIAFFSWLLLPVSMLPTFLGMSGKLYFLGAWVAGIFMLIATKNFDVTQKNADARNLLKASVVYLPVILLLILFDANI